MGDEERNAFLDEVETKVQKEKALNAEKAAQLAQSNAQFDELKSGIQHMLAQLGIDVAIASNADLLESLGDIEEKINELIAAKVIVSRICKYRCSVFKHWLKQMIAGNVDGRVGPREPKCDQTHFGAGSACAADRRAASPARPIHRV